MPLSATFGSAVAIGFFAATMSKSMRPSPRFLNL
jgi:hypothetical protein